PPDSVLRKYLGDDWAKQLADAPDEVKDNTYRQIHALELEYWSTYKFDWKAVVLGAAETERDKWVTLFNEARSALRNKLESNDVKALRNFDDKDWLQTSLKAYEQILSLAPASSLWRNPDQILILRRQDPTTEPQALFYVRAWFGDAASQM